MAKVKRSGWVLLNLMCAPVHFASKQIARVVPHNHHKVAHVSLGVVLILTGSTLATITWPGVPHVVSDALAWLVHGFGSAPIIDAVLKDKL